MNDPQSFQKGCGASHRAEQSTLIFNIHNESCYTFSPTAGCNWLPLISRTYLIARETNKLEQLERPRGQHGNHLQEVDKQCNG